MNITATVTENNISVYYNGKLYPPINKSHPNFERVKDAIKTKNYSAIPSLIDIASSVKKFVSKHSNVKVENGLVYYKDQVLNNLITKRIFELIKEGFDSQPLINFIENLHKNPSNRAVNELYSFLEHFSLPITEDGCFLAYKAVRNDYKDIYSGTFDNSVGKTPKVERNTVDENKDRHCSHGLHVGAISYVTFYGAFSNGISPNGNRLMVVKVDPKNAVCVPGDHECSKLRVCEYEVISEITDIENILKMAVYTSEGKESNMKTNVFQDLDSEDENDTFDSDEDYCDWYDSEDDEVEELDVDSEDYSQGYSDGTSDSNLEVPYEDPTDETADYRSGYKTAYSDLS